MEYSGIDVMKIVREINNFIEHVAAVIRRIAKAIGKLGGIFNRKAKRYFYSINDKKHRYITLKKYDYKPVAKKNQPYQRRNY